MANVNLNYNPPFTPPQGDTRQWAIDEFIRLGELITGLFDRGEFTATLTGFTSATTGQITYERIGDVVSLSVRTDITGTSNATTMTLTGLPVQIIPEGSRSCLVRVQDAGTWMLGRAVIAADGSVTFYTNPGTGAFTASGIKGLGQLDTTYTL